MIRNYIKILCIPALLILALAISSCGLVTGAFFEKGNNDGQLADEASERNGVVITTIESVFSQPDIKSDRLTQVIYNQAVEILEDKGVWMHIYAEDGTEGWILSESVRKKCLPPQSNIRLLVTDKSKIIENRPGNGAMIIEVVTGTRLAGVNKKNGWYQVLLPDGKTGYISESGTIELGENKNPPVTSSSDFIATALKFKGSKYLVGGRSYMGMDEKGLVYLCSRLNGVNLPLDINEMSTFGKPVERQNLLPGDLIFFRLDNGGQTVGIYMGNNEFIHAAIPYVTVDSLETPFYGERYLSARRIFGK